jgi:hypothetical protein
MERTSIWIVNILLGPYDLLDVCKDLLSWQQRCNDNEDPPITAVLFSGEGDAVYCRQFIGG